MTAITTTDTVAQTTPSREEHQDVLASRKNVLCIRDLRKAFGGQIVLDGASAELREGEVVLLRGNNGSGKTTLLNILSGNLEPDAGSIHLQVNGAAEHFRFPRRWWENVNPFDHFTPERVAREGVGRTWQDVRLFNTLTLADNIAVASPSQAGESPFNVLLRYGTVRREEISNRQTTANRLKALGLGDRADSSADRISLGQTKRVAIARAVQAGARILFLDEPLAGLDAQGIDSILEILRQLAREHRVTLVIVEHVFNIPRVLDLADTVWTLQAGKITTDSSSAVRAQSSEPRIADIATWMAALVDRKVASVQESLPGGAILWKLRAQASDSGNGGHPAVEIRNLVVKRGQRSVIGGDEVGTKVEGLSFTIRRGEIAVLEAPNGWGKSTLAEAIMGLLPIQSGEILIHNRAISNLSVWERVKVGLQFLQSRNSGFPDLTVRQVMALAGNPTSNGTTESKGSQHIGSLSGGEKQRVGIAAIQRSSVGIYDEPFSALDVSSIEIEGFASLCSKHSTLLILLPKG